MIKESIGILQSYTDIDIPTYWLLFTGDFTKEYLDPSTAIMISPDDRLKILNNDKTIIVNDKFENIHKKLLHEFEGSFCILIKG